MYHALRKTLENISDKIINTVNTIIRVSTALGVEPGLSSDGTTNGKTPGVINGGGIIGTIATSVNSLGTALGVETGLNANGTTNGKTPGVATSGGIYSNLNNFNATVESLKTDINTANTNATAAKTAATACDNKIKNVSTSVEKMGTVLGIETGLNVDGTSNGKVPGTIQAGGVVSNVTTSINNITYVLGVESGLNPDGTSNGKTPGAMASGTGGNAGSLINAINKIGDVLGIETGIVTVPLGGTIGGSGSGGTSGGSSGGTVGSSTIKVEPTYEKYVNPAKDSSGNGINIVNVLNPNGGTPIPQGGSPYPVYITNSNGSTTTSNISNIVVMTDDKGTVFCRFDLPSNGCIWLDGPLGITSSTSINDILRKQITLLVKDVSGSRSANMWINSEGVATIARQNVTNKHIGVWNDGPAAYSFMMILR